jgi:hypothetical protein
MELQYKRIKNKENDIVPNYLPGGDDDAPMIGDEDPEK